MNMFQGGFPPNYPVDTSHMQCGCAPIDPFANIDPNTKKVAAIIFLTNHLLNMDFDSFDSYRKQHKADWVIDEYIYLVTKKLMEMDKDEFIKYQEQYREKVRQSSKDGDESSDTDRQKGSGESREANLGKDGKSDHRNN